MMKDGDKEGMMNQNEEEEKGKTDGQKKKEEKELKIRNGLSSFLNDFFSFQKIFHLSSSLSPFFLSLSISFLSSFFLSSTLRERERGRE